VWSVLQTLRLRRFMSAFGGKADMALSSWNVANDKADMPIGPIAGIYDTWGAMAEIPSTHYVKSDDVHIAYQVIGEGSFDLCSFRVSCQT
jgi:hypothetical protein